MSAGRKLAHAAVLGLGVFAGLLMWSRLKIVTDTPRSAYAVPRTAEPETDVSREAGDPQADSDPAGEAESSENPSTP